MGLKVTEAYVILAKISKFLLLLSCKDEKGNRMLSLHVPFQKCITVFMHTLHRPLTETNNIPNKNPHILKKINYLMEVTSLNDLIQL